MLLAAVFVPLFQSLLALKSHALRRDVCYKIDSATKSLIDAAILYLRRGWRVILISSIKAT